MKKALVLLLGLAGCSSFDHDFETWSPKHTMDSSGPLIGRWDGTWHSDDSGHEGTLRCIITRGDSAYEARYYATYSWCIFPFSFEYTVPMTAVVEGDPPLGNGAWKLRGSAELGCWVAGGLYEYEARVENGEFIATYRSSFDRGIFRMKRVP